MTERTRSVLVGEQSNTLAEIDDRDSVSLRELQEYLCEHLQTDGFSGNALLRLSVDGSRVETTQGAQVLVRTVRFLWEFCASAKRAGESIPDEIVARFPTLDHYRVSLIDAGGNVIAGCHRIAFAEIEGIAKALKLPPFNGQPMRPAELPAEEVTA